MALLGTIMYISKDGTFAFIWPDASEHGPALLRREDFPDLWERIEVGEILRFVISGNDVRGTVSLVSQIGTERIDPPAIALDQAALGSSANWRDQSRA